MEITYLRIHSKTNKKKTVMQHLEAIALPHIQSKMQILLSVTKHLS